MKKIALLIVVLTLLMSSAQAVVVLQYHNISDSAPRSTRISPALFKQHLDYLSDNDFKVLSLPAFIKHLNEKIPFPDKSVLLTFDDAYRNILENAVPLLNKKKFPYTIFVSTQPIQQKLANFMSWQDLKVMSENGASIANHSMTHSYLIRRLDDESESQWEARVRDEIQSAQKLIETHTGQNIKAFAYPYGEFDKETTNILSELGYIAFAQHSGAFSVSHNKLDIPRFTFGGRFGQMDDFSLKVKTLPLPFAGIEILDENNYSLQDQVLTLDVKRPKLKIKLQKDFQDLDVQCYLSGKGKIIRTPIRHGYLFQTELNIPEGRSKYNCTAMSAHGRYYWFSQLWIRRLEGGLWYQDEIE